VSDPQDRKERIPFEPKKSKKGKKQTQLDKNKKAGKKPTSTPQFVTKQKSEVASSSKSTAVSGDIPPEVNRRMVRRAALFSGIPSSLGILIFVASYVVVVNKWFELPNTVVVLVSMLCFGLGVVGLSYGALSASWEPGRTGGWWGGAEFSKNFGYLRSAWKAQRNKKSSKASEE
jgi:VIT1/CCC1 family predicted Fe2+/Mn2+ transporter